MSTIPDNDAELDVWQSSYVDLVKANAPAWGIPDDAVAKLLASQTTWNTAYADAKNKKQRDTGEVQAKEDAKTDYTTVLRDFTNEYLANNHLVSDSDRQHLNITVPTDTHTPVPVPTSTPVITIDFSVRSKHTLNFVDDATPQSKAKPFGVHGGEVYSKVGDATVFVFLGTCTSTPFVVNYTDADAGKIASYRMRWVNTRGEQGPLGSIVSAHIVG